MPFPSLPCTLALPLTPCVAQRQGVGEVWGCCGTWGRVSGGERPFEGLTGMRGVEGGGAGLLVPVLGGRGWGAQGWGAQSWGARQWELEPPQSAYEALFGSD